MPLSAGIRLGPYEILAPLGAGGMGEVYRARDSKLGRDVAVKILPPEVAGDAERRLRFEQEARAATALNHPNVVHVYDIGSSDSIYYIALELVEGRTLREVLASGPLPVKKLLDVAVQVADGLAKAHAAGIIHRDLKPENLMVSKEGHVKILDFGMAKLAEPAPDDLTEQPTSPKITRTGLILGTVGYMSPEQAAGQPVDFRSDQFSFGTIVYELASGRRAFLRKTAAETLTAILREQPEPLAQVALLLPTPLRWIVEERCLAKDREERYASTRDLLRDLQSVRDHMSEASAVGLPGMTPLPRRRRSLWLVAGVLAGVMTGLLAGRRMTTKQPPELPSFHQLTFRRGTIWSARFAPDGQTIIYGAAWEGRPVEPFLTRVSSPESRPLGFPSTEILSISAPGEMAVSLDRRYVGGWSYTGTLARVPLAGGAPRQVLEDVDWADWSADGAELAVVRNVGGKTRLELPVGKILYETPGWISHARVSPKGDRVAFLDHPREGDDRGSVAVVDLSGKTKTLAGVFASEQGLAWSPAGDEVWFTASDSGSARALHAVTLAGAHRLLLRTPGMLTLHDVSRDGRALLSRDSVRTGIFGVAPGQAKEQDLSVHDWSIVADLSLDGKLLCISEQGEGGGGPNYAIYLRRNDNLSPAVLLGEGFGQGISPDGKWLVSVVPSAPRQIRLLPTGPGEMKRLPQTGIEYYGAATWFPDAKRLLSVGNEPGHGARLYVQDLGQGRPTPISPEGVSFPFGTHPLSPDGALVAAIGPDKKPYLYPVEGGEPRPVVGLEAGEIPTGWAADGRSLYVFRRGELPCRVHRVELATGRRELWKEITPPDLAGIIAIPRILVTPDGRSYVYNYRRIFSELYLVEGLR